MASRMLRSVLLGAASLSLCGPAVAQDADEEPDPIILGIALADTRPDPPRGPVAAIKLLRARDHITAMEPLN
jgi:hypothetical protein